MKYFGKATVKVNGIVLESKPGASIDLGGTSRESVVSDQGTMGFTETQKPSRIEAEMLIKVGVTVDGTRNLTDASVIFECDTGQRYVVRGGYTVDPPTISGGVAKFVFMGEPAQEMA